MVFLHASSSIALQVFRRAARAAALVLLAGIGLSLLPPCFAQTGSWSSTANMRQSRLGHAATLLNDGTVLVEGGLTNSSDTAGAEIYSPAKHQWRPTGAMNVPRGGHTSTLLKDGQVLGGRRLQLFS